MTVEQSWDDILTRLVNGGSVRVERVYGKRVYYCGSRKVGIGEVRDLQDRGYVTIVSHSRDWETCTMVATDKVMREHSHLIHT